MEIYKVIYLYKDMHAVSNAINILDPAQIIDKKICKNQEQTGPTAGKCHNGKSSTSARGFSAWFDATNGAGASGGDYETESKKMEKWSAHNAGVVSKETAALTREEKGVVSSVFAKVIEGAEILAPAKVIDGKICKTHQKENGGDAGKCIVGTSSISGSNGKGLSEWFDSAKGAGQENGAYKDESQKMEKWSTHNAKVVSKDTTSNLSREEKGVVRKQ